PIHSLSLHDALPIVTLCMKQFFYSINPMFHGRFPPSYPFFIICTLKTTCQNKTDTMNNNYYIITSIQCKIFDKSVMHLLLYKGANEGSHRFIGDKRF